jgi:hypothetical protein
MFARLLFVAAREHLVSLLSAYRRPLAIQEPRLLQWGAGRRRPCFVRGKLCERSKRKYHIALMNWRQEIHRELNRDCRYSAHVHS